jgi:hypothetical protein
METEFANKLVQLMEVIASTLMNVVRVIVTL